MQREDISATVDLLERIAAKGTPAEVAESVGHLERLKFLAWKREQPHSSAPSRTSDEQDRYMTISGVAARHGLSKSYCGDPGSLAAGAGDSSRGYAATRPAAARLGMLRGQGSG